MTTVSAPGIAAIASYVPSARLGTAELVERFGFERAFLDDKIGFTERAVAASDEAVSDMAVRAAEALFAQGVVVPTDIDALILVTQNPDYRLPTTANMVQARLGLRSDVLAFDVNQGCSGFVIGLGVAQGLILAHGFRHVLLITAEAYSKVMDPADRNTVPLFGDGAAATLVSAGGGGRVGTMRFGSDGAGAEQLIVRGGGSRNPSQPPAGEGALYMNGRGIFNFAVRAVPAVLRDCVTANGLSLEQVDYFVLHQASAYMVGAIAQALELPGDRVPWLLADVGNTVSSTIPMALERLGGPSALAGKTVALCGFGVGLSWAAAIVRF